MKNLAPMKGDRVVLPCVEYIRLKKIVDILSTNVGEVTLQTRGGSVLHTPASGLIML